MPAKRQRGPSRRGKKKVSFVRAGYDLIVLICGGSIGAFTVILYQLMMAGTSAETIFIFLVFEIIVAWTILYYMRNRVLTKLPD